MNIRLKSAPLAVGVAILAMGTGSANAALLDGAPPTGGDNTSVFISLVERNSVNQIVRNLVIDTGARALDVFAGTPWSTTAAQEANILSFVSSAASTSRILFNVGGALTDTSFSTANQGFLTTGNAAGPSIDNYTALGNGVVTTVAKIGNANNGTFNANGVLASNGPSDPGFHGNSWGDDYGGTILPSNEVLLGTVNQIIGWRLGDDISFEIVRSQLGLISSNSLTGDISFDATVVPLPGTVWLLASGLGFLGARRAVRRSRQAA